MRSDLRALRERIRQVEAGGHRETPLRRAHNRKLRAHQTLRGGSGWWGEGMDGVKLIWEGVLTLQRKSKNDERHIELYDSGVLVKNQR